MLFHKGGPLQGQSRGYAFVTFAKPDGVVTALNKLNGHMVLNRPIVVRLAKNVNYDDLDRPKAKIEIPALGTGKKEGKISKEDAIKAIEQKLQLLESQGDELDLEFNQSFMSEIPLIQKYQFNKDRDANGSTSTSQRRNYKSNTGPYGRHQRPKRR